MLIFIDMWRISVKMVLITTVVFLLSTSTTALAGEKKTGGVTGSLPSGKWLTLESEHFIIHFPEDCDKLALKVAGIAENAHKKLSVDIFWKPKSKTHIKIIDWYDSINGWASILPRNTIAIYPAGPGLEALELTFTDDWLRMVITHEYTHILTLDMASGIPGFVRTLFGRSMASIPNIYMPKWIIEGIAEYHETKHTGGGRLRGPYFDMVLRMAVLERNFNNLAQAQAGIDSWPLSTEYIYGGIFVQYLIERFGEERFLKIFECQSRLIAPVLPWLPGFYEAFIVSLYWLATDPVRENGLYTFYSPYEKLWNDWYASLAVRYEKTKDRIKERGLTVSEKLTKNGYGTAIPRFSPDGSKIAYVSRGPDQYAQLRIMDKDGDNDRLLYEGNVRSIDWSPDGKLIAFSMLDFWRGIYYFSDIYTCEVDTRRIRRLTRGLRARCPSWSPDGKKLLFAINTGAGNTDLAILDLEKKEEPVSYLTDTNDMTYYSGCAWSPNGDRIAFVRLVPGSLQQICTSNIEGGDIRELTDGKSQDFTPEWSHDGSALLFTSGRTGIYNIYAIKMKTGKTVSLTNVLGGAISPSLSPDGTTTTYADYSSRGWDVAVGRLDIEKAPEAGKSATLLQDMKYSEPEQKFKVRGYNTIDTLFPTGWAPFFYYTGEYGAQIAGYDVLEKHFYTLQMGYNSFYYRPYIAAAYRYEGAKYRGYPVFCDITAYRQPAILPSVMTNAFGEYVDYWEDRKVFKAALGMKVYRTTRTSVELAAGYENRQFSRLSHLEPGGVVPGTGKLISVFMSGIFNDTKNYLKGISPADGRKIKLTGRTSGPTLGSDYRIESFTADLAQFISSPVARHHVIMVRVKGGMSEGDIIDQRGLFHVGGSEQGTVFVEDEKIAFRGYEDNAFLGMKALVATFEYRFPLRLIENGPSTRPIFFRKLSGYVFAESGNAWSGPMYLKALNASVGCGLRLTTDLFYQRLDGYAAEVGFAHGFDKKGINQVYFSVSMLW